MKRNEFIKLFTLGIIVSMVFPVLLIPKETESTKILNIKTGGNITIRDSSPNPILHISNKGRIGFGHICPEYKLEVIKNKYC